MSLLNKTNSVLNLLKMNEKNSGLSFNYPDLNNYENINKFLKTNIASMPNLNLNINNISDENKNKNINNIQNLNLNNTIYTDNLQNINDNKIYNNDIITQELPLEEKNNNNELKINNNNNNNNINNLNNMNKININTSQEIDYNYNRFSKIIDENNLLKEQLLKLDSENKLNKTKSERQILIIREENSKLQLEIQRLIGQERISYNKYENDLKEKNDTINTLQNSIATLKEKIKLLTNENITMLNSIQNLNNKIMSLTNDKQFLIEEISELNKSLNNKIKPKLMKNEDYLLSLENQIALLKKDNDSLIENAKRQKNIINNMEKENKMLRETIDSYNTIQTIEDINIKNINNNKNIKKYISSKILNKKQNKSITNIKNTNGINNNINNINNIKKRNYYNDNEIDNKMINQCLSETKLNFVYPEKSLDHYNYNYKKKDKNNNIKINIRNISNGRNSIKNKSNSNIRTNNFLYYNTTIKKKNNLQIKNNFYKQRPKNKIINNNNNVQLDLDDIDMDNKENFLINNKSSFSQSKSKSLLSSYTEDITPNGFN